MAVFEGGTLFVLASVIHTTRFYDSVQRWKHTAGDIAFWNSQPIASLKNKTIQSQKKKKKKQSTVSVLRKLITVYTSTAERGADGVGLIFSEHFFSSYTPPLLSKTVLTIIFTGETATCTHLLTATHNIL